MKRRYFLAGSLALLPSLGLLRSAWAAPAWDLASDELTGGFQVPLLQEFATILKDSTRGQMNIVVSPDSALIPAWELPTAIKTGEVEIAASLLTHLLPGRPALGIDGLPFLTEGTQRAKQLAERTRPYLIEMLNAAGLRLLFVLPQAPTGLFTFQAASGPEGMVGWRIATLHPEASRFVETLGAVPIETTLADLPATLFGSEPMDGLMASAEQGLRVGAERAFKQFYDLRAAMPWTTVVMNKAVFEPIASVTQELLFHTADDTEQRGWSFALNSATQGPQALMAKGVVVSQENDGLAEALRIVGKESGRAWLADAGIDGETLLRAFRV